jgi:hypothetical protein
LVGLVVDTAVDSGVLLGLEIVVGFAEEDAEVEEVDRLDGPVEPPPAHAAHDIATSRARPAASMPGGSASPTRWGLRRCIEG